MCKSLLCSFANTYEILLWRQVARGETDERVGSKSDLFGRANVAEGSRREDWGSLSRFQVEDLYKGAIQLLSSAVT